MTGRDEIRIFVRAGWRTLTFDKERSGTVEEAFSNNGLIIGDHEIMKIQGSILQFYLTTHLH